MMRSKPAPPERPAMSAAPLPEAQAQALFRQMLFIRRFEEAVIGLWAELGSEGHRHVYIGQEAVGAGIFALLREDDRILTTHRNHGHVILRGADPGRTLAEILLRADGINGGRGGSAGITPGDLGFLFTTAQVGGGVGLGAGAGFAQKVKGRGGIALAFFGDGGLEEGIAFESLNMAALHALPVLYVCENNSLGVTTGRAQNEWSSSSMAAATLADVPRALQIPAEPVAGEDVELILELAGRLIAGVRAGQGPAFIEARTHRWPGSRSFNPQLVAGATDLQWIADPASAPEEHAGWINHYDPVVLFGRRLLGRGHLDPSAMQTMDEEIQERLRAARAFALASPLPTPEQILAGVFAD